MRIAEMLQAIATWLESPDNEAILLAEYDDQCLKVVAESCVEAANTLKKAAQNVDKIEDNTPIQVKEVRKIVDQAYSEVLKNNWKEVGKLFGIGDKLCGNDMVDAMEAIRILPYFAKEPQFPSVPMQYWKEYALGYCEAWNLSIEETDKEINRVDEFFNHFKNRQSKYESFSDENELDGIAKLAKLANLLDSSGDPELIKQASLIDELLLTVAASPELLSEKRKEADRRIEELKKKYEESKKKLDEKNKVVEVKKAIDNSGMTEEFKINMQPLKSRYCPNHPGVSMLRLEDQVYQCPLDSKTFNYETGYDLESGEHVPGGSVQNQTEMLNDNMYTNFDTRESRTKN
jgi:hypothetical protein